MANFKAMGVFKTVLSVSLGIIILVAIIFFSFRKKEKGVPQVSTEIKIEEIWELPSALDEISGFDFIDDERIVAIQDEIGTVFIYNLNSKKIEDKIEFAGNGDYEGIAVRGQDIFVTESDGTITIIKNFKENPEVQQVKTFLSESQDIESLGFDEKNNRMLLASKEKESFSNTKKGIYALNLEDLEMEKDPVFMLNLEESIFEKVNQKKIYNRFQPTDIAIHPSSRRIFLVEGTNPKLLVLNEDAKAQKLYFFDRNKFPQPEGLAFNPSEELFISTEGNPGKLYKISLK